MRSELVVLLVRCLLALLVVVSPASTANGRDPAPPAARLRAPGANPAVAHLAQAVLRVSPRDAGDVAVVAHRGRGEVAAAAAVDVHAGAS